MRKTGIVVALSAMLLIGTAAGAYAGSNLQQIKAYLNKGVRITHIHSDTYMEDGKDLLSTMREPVSLQDGQGKPLYPITYDGLTYLPLRTIGELLGARLTWESGNQAIDMVESPYYAFNAADQAIMDKYGFALKVPTWIPDLMVDYYSLTDTDGVATVHIRYMVQDQSLHQRHEEIAMIKVYRADQWSNQSGKSAGAVIAQNDKRVCVAIPNKAVSLAEGTRDHVNFTAYSNILAAYNYFITIEQK